jgi:pSer/pThr/pTyr-binding forkhead associated (FHA) protein
MPYLLQKDRDGSTIQYWNLHEGPTTVGRDSKVNARVDDQELSRQHFQITHEDTGFTIKDLSSRNGTFVNGQRVTEKVLKPNDLITAGKSTFSFMEGLTTLSMKLDQDIKNLEKFKSGSGDQKPK